MTRNIVMDLITERIIVKTFVQSGWEVLSGDYTKKDFPDLPFPEGKKVRVTIEYVDEEE